ncbi:MAG: GNAT family N-acetyltransferase [Bacteroidia bacterium]
MAYTIRWGSPEDAPAIQALIQELAEYERAPDAVDTTPESLRQDGFGNDPCFRVFVAEDDKAGVVGIALYFIGYSTWKGRMLYLDDLVVREQFRGSGIGRALLDSVMEQAKVEKAKVVCWQVLDWNTPAIDFYKKIGATFQTDWYNCRIYEEGIEGWNKN